MHAGQQDDGQNNRNGYESKPMIEPNGCGSIPSKISRPGDVIESADYSQESEQPYGDRYSTAGMKQTQRKEKGVGTYQGRQAYTG
jgi:hypothetical protein